MKSILLASASIVGFAGVAAAEVGFTGDATLGYNDDDYGDPEGFYWSSSVTVMLSQELDNGLTATAEVGVDLVDTSSSADDGGSDAGELGIDLESYDFVLGLESDMAGLWFGTTDFAAQTYWNAVGDMAHDNFSEADGETVLRGQVMYGGVTVGLSYMLDDDFTIDLDESASPAGDDTDIDGTGDLVQLSLGATAEFGAYNVSMAYQEEIEDQYLIEQIDEDGVTNDVFNGNGDISNDQVFGISVSTSFAGADVALGYATNMTDDTNSTGVSVSYPFGPVVVGASYANNSDDTDNYEVTLGYSSGPVVVDASYSDNTDGTDQEYSIDGTYDLGNGLMVLAGIHGGEDNTDEIDYYVASSYDLGGGASVLVSYAEDEDNREDDEIGGPEYLKGTTVEVSFEF